MKLDVRYPLLLRARPRRCAEARNVYITEASIVDVPEIAARETEVLFETPRMEIRGSTSVQVAPDKPRTVYGRSRLIGYDGRLFRKLDITRPHLLAQAFSGISWSAAVFERDADINLSVSAGSLNPVTAALRMQFDWELERESAVDSGVTIAWPNPGGSVQRIRKREITTFHDVQDSLEDIDGDILDRSKSMIEAEKDRLLCVDGELWLSCGPPAWKVEAYDDGAKVITSMSMAVVPEGFDPSLQRRYFSLDRQAEAEEFMGFCARKNPHEQRDHRWTKATGEYEATVDDIRLRFDQNDRELERLGLAFAMEAARRLRSSPEKAELLSSADVAVVEEGFQAILATNPILGEVVSVGHIAHGLTEAWTKLGMPMAWCTHASSRARFGGEAAKTALALADERDIHVDIPLGNFLTTPMSGPTSR